MVFDGYYEISTKAMTPQTYASGKVGATVTFTESIRVTMKDNFLESQD